LVFFLFFEYFQHLLSILPIYSCQKNSSTFCVVLLMVPRFYQRIIENYGFFLKDRDISNSKFF